MREKKVKPTHKSILHSLNSINSMNHRYAPSHYDSELNMYH